MKRASLVAFFVFAGCNNFDALVERCVADGRCGEGGSTAPPQLVFDKTSVDFGSRTSDERPTERLSINNRAGGVAESLTLNVEGPAAADFSFSNLCSSSLSVEQSCPVDVAFVPRTVALGVRSAELVLRASRGDTVRLALRAEVTSALSLPTELVFGDVASGGQLTMPLTVKSNLSRPSSVVPTVSAPFFIASNGCISVGARQSCVIQIRFEAPSPGDQAQSMDVDVEGNRSSVNLSARSVAAGSLQLLPASLFVDDAGAAVERLAVRDIPFRLTNTGSLEVRSIDYGLTSAGAWTIADAGCSSLAPGASCDGVLRFSPVAIGFYPATFSVDAGAIGGGTLSGVGRGVGVATFLVSVNTPDAGVYVTQSLDGGRCYGVCPYPVWTDPSAPNAMRVTARVSPVLGPALFSTSQSGACDGSVCDLVLARDAVRLDVTQEPVPIAFVTNQRFTGAFDGGLRGVDEVCQRVARAAAVPGRFEALVALADGGAGFSRFSPSVVYVRPNGSPQGLVSADAGTQFTTETGGAVSNSWTGLNGATCDDWTSTNSNGGTSSFSTNPWQISSQACVVGMQLLCLSQSRGRPEIPPGGWAMVAVPTNGLRTGFQSECDATRAALGLIEVWPYITSLGRPACRSFDAPDGGLADGGVWEAGLAGALYRADGLLLSADVRELQRCSDQNFTPTFQNAVGLAVVDGGVVDAMALPVRTGANPSGNYGIGYSPSTSSNLCSNWSTTTSSTYYVGSAQGAGTNWWWGGSYSQTSCSAPSYIYCVGHR